MAVFGKNKKNAVIAVFLLLAAGTTFGQSISKAVWDAKDKAYKIENGAKLRIGVDNDKWGQAIVAYWDKVHPEHRGMVEYVNFASANGTDQITQLQGEAPDVCMVIDGEVARNVQSLSQLDKILISVAKKVCQEPFLSNANPGNKYTFVPIAYDGMVFAWNKNMLEALGLDTADKNKDGLPDAFDTWEKIFAWSKTLEAKRPVYKGKPVNIVFPMSLGNQWSYYSSLTSAGWQLFADGNPANPGFDSPKFRDSFEFLKAAAAAKISVEANGKVTPGASMLWRWEDFLNNEISPFGLCGTWMDVAEAEKMTGSDFKFSRMPVWHGNQLTPLVKTKGFVINGFSKYPSAAAELLRVLLTKEGMQVMIDNSSYIPALVKKAPISPNYSDDIDKQEMSAAFAYNYPEPSKHLPGNPAMMCMQVYYNINIEQTYFSVWDGTKTPAEAQAEILKNSNAWYMENNK